jgi:hypothetical protein
VVALSIPHAGGRGGGGECVQRESLRFQGVAGVDLPCCKNVLFQLKPAETEC